MSSLSDSAAKNKDKKKQCDIQGCQKRSVGPHFCVAHGGGKRCNHPDCTKHVRDTTGYCKTHGGGLRCRFDGCNKAAADSKGFCRAHGGGKRCLFEGCLKGAEGPTNYCIAHGGGRRCQAIGCVNGARGTTGYCKQHGGGIRCTFEGCLKSSANSSLLCKAHGGGKRCLHPDCNKGAQGKTNFCKAHGGGARCEYEGCLKAARDLTHFCKAHGGGKRCSTPNCSSSARDGYDKCRVHGGGPRAMSSRQDNVPNQNDSLLSQCDPNELGSVLEPTSGEQVSTMDAQDMHSRAVYQQQVGDLLSQDQGLMTQTLEEVAQQQPSSNLHHLPFPAASSSSSPIASSSSSSSSTYFVPHSNLMNEMNVPSVSSYIICDAPDCQVEALHGASFCYFHSLAPLPNNDDASKPPHCSIPGCQLPLFDPSMPIPQFQPPFCPMHSAMKLDGIVQPTQTLPNSLNLRDMTEVPQQQSQIVEPVAPLPQHQSIEQPEEEVNIPMMNSSETSSSVGIIGEKRKEVPI